MSVLTARSPGTRHTPTTPPVFSFSRRTARHPTGGKRRGFGPDAVRVVAERLVERRELSDGAVYQVGSGRIVKRVTINPHRAQQLLGGVGMSSQQRLTADDDDLARSCNAAAGAKDVLKLLDVHARPADRSPNAPGGRGRCRTDCFGGGGIPPPQDRARRRIASHSCSRRGLHSATAGDGLWLAHRLHVDRARWRPALVGSRSIASTTARASARLLWSIS